MKAFFLALNRALSAHRWLTTVALLLVVAAAVVLALRLDYEEDIAKFLPVNDEKQAYAEAARQLTNQDRIVIIFKAGTKESEAKAERESHEMVKHAMDCFETLFAEADTAHTVSDLQVTVDETQMLDMLSFVTENAPYFLTADDYRRMDSLLAVPDFMATQLAQDKQMLILPTAGMAAQTLRYDPLQLFTPLLGRLQQMGRNSQFTVDEGYVFADCSNFNLQSSIFNGQYGLAFLTSPYGMSESARNAELAALIDSVSAQVMACCPGVKVSAVGGPLIAVSNASQIKHDALVAVVIAVVLIVALLLWHYRRVSYLLWIAASLAFGWLLAVATMSLLHGSMSVIVLGIGSVIIGIAVNYPLHYLDHLKETGNGRQTLRDMVQPLLIGNVTTVSAFLCLLWLDAAAMRDLGLFGALMLVFTILFVLVGLPLFSRGGNRGTRYEVRGTRCGNRDTRCEVRGTRLPCHRLFRSRLFRSRLFSYLVPRTSYLEKTITAPRTSYLENSYLVPRNLAPRNLVLPLVLLLTLVLGYFSLQTSFDSDLRHINYMTDSQREGMELLASLSEDMPQEMVTMVPSQAVQRERLQLWRAFSERHPSLADSLSAAAALQGFSPDAFQPFHHLLTASLEPQAADYFAPVGRFLGGQRLVNVQNVGAQLVEILQDNFNYVSFVCGVVVFFFLWLSFGRIELAMMSFLPLAVSWLWILGLMHLLGVQFNIVNIILATFIFGQGDDYTIFITEGLLYEYRTGRRRLASYRRSVVLSAVLMFIGIGTLILAEHPALRSLAQVTIIGMGTVVVMAYYLPPMVFRWLVRGATTSLGVARANRAEMSRVVAAKLPITLKRVAYSAFALGFFLSFMYLFVLPFTWLYFHVGKATEARKLKFHKMLRRMSDFVVHRVPGVRFYLENRVGETFERPAVVISNHQSHLDLMCLMMLTPRIVFLTNDWVWHNPFYGMVIHRAEFYPVSNGIEHHLDQLRDLYCRGYSICVFPEGTRSDDCSILRFHKGAFYLAEQLGADILPVFLHGVGHVLPKRDFLLRQGRIDVEVGRRIALDDARFSADLLERTRQMRRYYQEHYRQMCERLEDDDYWRPYRRLAQY